MATVPTAAATVAHAVRWSVNGLAMALRMSTSSGAGGATPLESDDCSYARDQLSPMVIVGSFESMAKEGSDER